MLIRLLTLMTVADRRMPPARDLTRDANLCRQ